MLELEMMAPGPLTSIDVFSALNPINGGHRRARWSSGVKKSSDTLLRDSPYLPTYVILRYPPYLPRMEYYSTLPTFDRQNHATSCSSVRRVREVFSYRGKGIFALKELSIMQW